MAEEHQQKHEPPPRPSIIDWLGPGPVVTIILTVGSALVVGAVSLWSLVGAHAGSIALLTDLSRDHEERIRAQEQRPPRLGPSLDEIRAECEKLGDVVAGCKERASVIERDVKHIQSEQDRLCQRVMSCPKR